MKIVRLKQEFVEQAIEVDSEFLDKHTRSYMYIKVKVESIDYLIPFRSNISHHYCYKFSDYNLDSKYIDFTKSIPLINPNIIYSDVIVERSYFELYETNIRNVASVFSKYLINDHKNNRFGIDHKKMLEIQKVF